MKKQPETTILENRSVYFDFDFDLSFDSLKSKSTRIDAMKKQTPFGDTV